MSDTLCDLAFTGTREDPSPFQLMCATSLLTYLHRIGYRRLHHGDCVGSDRAVAEIARGLGYYIVSHPPTNDSKRAYYPADEERAALPYLHRDAMIVMESSMGLALPRTEGRTAHSGTWATISMMSRRRLTHWIVSPVVMKRVDP